MDYNTAFKINRLEDELAFTKKEANKVIKENKELKAEIRDLKKQLQSANASIAKYKHNITMSNLKILRNLDDGKIVSSRKD